MAGNRKTKRRLQFIRQKFPKKMQKKLVLVYMITILEIGRASCRERVYVLV